MKVGKMVNFGFGNKVWYGIGFFFGSLSMVGLVKIVSIFGVRKLSVGGVELVVFLRWWVWLLVLFMFVLFWVKGMSLEDDFEVIMKIRYYLWWGCGWEDEWRWGLLMVVDL